MSATMEAAHTRPTERREGEEIEPTRVRCYSCSATGSLDRDVGRCHQCGAWVEVIEAGEGQEAR